MEDGLKDGQGKYRQICPVCNGLVSLDVDCSDCHYYPMEDLGCTKDYFGSYSPYEEISPPGSKGPAQFCSPAECLHLLQCPQCTFCGYLTVDKVTL